MYPRTKTIRRTLQAHFISKLQLLDIHDNMKSLQT